jgi:adenylate kinase
MVLNLIFLGAPGAGKGTVAQKATEHYGVVQISTGDLFRAKAKENTPEGKRIKELLEAGKYVDDATTVALLKERLLQKDVAKGFILDGFPRTLPQAEELDVLLAQLKKKLSVVIDISVTEEKVVERICNRLTCSKCKKIYNKVSAGMIPKVAGKCDDDGAELVQRSDDKEDVVRSRYKTYVEKTLPLIEYYKKKGLLVSYDGNPPMEESVKRAYKIIDKFK